MILLTGATGTAGSFIANEFVRERACLLRILVRNRAKAARLEKVPTVEIVEGDMSKRSTLGPALDSVDRRATILRSDVKTNGEGGSWSRLSRRSARSSTPLKGVNGWRAVLGAAHMDLPVGEVDGVPAQGHQFDRPQAMPVGEQHHGGVAMAVAVGRRPPSSASAPRRR